LNRSCECAINDGATVTICFAGNSARTIFTAGDRSESRVTRYARIEMISVGVIHPCNSNAHVGFLFLMRDPLSPTAKAMSVFLFEVPHHTRNPPRLKRLDVFFVSAHWAWKPIGATSALASGSGSALSNSGSLAIFAAPRRCGRAHPRNRRRQAPCRCCREQRRLLC
jgi:hypothetical protein